MCVCIYIYIHTYTYIIRVAFRGLALEGAPEVGCSLKPPPNSVRDSSQDLAPVQVS